MTNIPFSQVTIIAASLGIFFLIVAFYKSIFHKRRHPTHASITPAAQPARRDDQPIKLADPFQQVPVDALPLSPSAGQQPSTVSFYPSLPKQPDTPVSAFRQFNPKKDFETTLTSPKNDTSYEWE